MRQRLEVPCPPRVLALAEAGRYPESEVGQLGRRLRLHLGLREALAEQQPGEAPAVVGRVVFDLLDLPAVVERLEPLPEAQRFALFALESGQVLPPDVELAPLAGVSRTVPHRMSSPSAGQARRRPGFRERPCARRGGA